MKSLESIASIHAIVEKWSITFDFIIDTNTSKFMQMLDVQLLKWHWRLIINHRFKCYFRLLWGFLMGNQLPSSTLLLCLSESFFQTNMEVKRVFVDLSCSRSFFTCIRTKFTSARYVIAMSNVPKIMCMIHVFQIKNIQTKLKLIKLQYQ